MKYHTLCALIAAMYVYNLQTSIYTAAIMYSMRLQLLLVTILLSSAIQLTAATSLTEVLLLTAARIYIVYGSNITYSKC